MFMTIKKNEVLPVEKEISEELYHSLLLGNEKVELDFDKTLSVGAEIILHTREKNLNLMEDLYYRNSLTATVTGIANSQFGNTSKMEVRLSKRYAEIYMDTGSHGVQSKTVVHFHTIRDLDFSASQKQDSVSMEVDTSKRYFLNELVVLESSKNGELNGRFKIFKINSIKQIDSFSEEVSTQGDQYYLELVTTTNQYLENYISKIGA